ncbi:MAG TPA: IS1380 family transposase [Steroidobacteraceae bacterium]|nr:IS1380 family transposase [Steroidobacteraceae bacterium]
MARRRAQVARRKRRIERRLRPKTWAAQPRPMYTASNIQYEHSDRVRGLESGGIGAMHRLAQHVGLVEAIDRHVEVLKVALPYHESDHVLGIAYNILSGGTCLQDIERRRQDEVYLDALGAQRIPDPTTAGDFCRRFDEAAIEALQTAINETRVRVWRAQPPPFFDEAVIDADGTLAATTGACKEGMDISYEGVWGYHPLVVSLANTQEPLYLINRSGNRPSSEGAAERFDQACTLCRTAGFRRVTFRGDTDFSQTQHLDRWAADGVRFVFGYDARANLIGLADALPPRAWTRLVRRPPDEVQTTPRQQPAKVKEALIVEREFKTLRLQSEAVAEFPYQPGACAQPYRMVVVRKNISVEQGDQRLFDQIRYFFYLTNDRETPAAEVVFLANDRCNQENLIDQLKHGVGATRMPVDTLLSNWAYMVMAALAWTLKAWFALRLPTTGRWAARYVAEKAVVLRMEFKAFLHAFMLIPVQVVRTSRRLVFRLLAWNPWQAVFLRGFDQLRQPLQC